MLDMYAGYPEVQNRRVPKVESFQQFRRSNSITTVSSLIVASRSQVLSKAPQLCSRLGQKAFGHVRTCIGTVSINSKTLHMEHNNKTYPKRASCQATQTFD